MTNWVKPEHVTQAMRLAAMGLYTAKPNPCVGCVIVSAAGEAVGEGWHMWPGMPHAEAMALGIAGARARDGDVYVTLEPCCHSGPEKRTPPCAPALIAAGVKRVAVGCLDPNPQVAGRGVEALRAAGIEVVVLPPIHDVAAVNRGYFSRMERGRPWVIAKWAMSLDGRIATRTGDAKWITGGPARSAASRTRAESGAVMVGIGTVLADDSHLTVRWGVDGAFTPPIRVVVDRELRLPMTSALVMTAREVPVQVFCGEGAAADKRKQLEEAGVTVTALPTIASCGNGARRRTSPTSSSAPFEMDSAGNASGVSTQAALAAESSSGTRMLATSNTDACRSLLCMETGLRILAAQGVNVVLAEGGAGLHGSLFDQGLVDEVHVYVNPRLVIGGREALGPVGGEGAAVVARALELKRVAQERIEGDLLVKGYVTLPEELLARGGEG